MLGMNLIRIASLTAALCLGLMLGVLFGGATHTAAILFVALGAALMVAVCTFADQE